MEYSTLSRRVADTRLKDGGAAHLRLQNLQRSIDNFPPQGMIDVRWQVRVAARVRDLGSKDDSVRLQLLGQCGHGRDVCYRNTAPFELSDDRSAAARAGPSSRHH